MSWVKEMTQWEVDMNTYIVELVSTSGHSFPIGHCVQTVWLSKEYVPGSQTTSISWLVDGHALK